MRNTHGVRFRAGTLCVPIRVTSPASKFPIRRHFPDRRFRPAGGKVRVGDESRMWLAQAVFTAR